MLLKNFGGLARQRNDSRPLMQVKLAYSVSQILKILPDIWTGIPKSSACPNGNIPVRTFLCIKINPKQGSSPVIQIEPLRVIRTT